MNCTRRLRANAREFAVALTNGCENLHLTGLCVKCFLSGCAKYVSEKNAGNGVYDKFNSVTSSLAEENNLDDAFMKAFNTTAGVNGVPGSNAKSMFGQYYNSWE